MTKSELASQIATHNNIHQNMAQSLVNLIFRTMAAALSDGERIEIRGFGSFSVRDYGGYLGMCPRDGSRVEVPPKRLPYFKVSKEMRERVNK